MKVLYDDEDVILDEQALLLEDYYRGGIQQQLADSLATNMEPYNRPVYSTTDISNNGMGTSQYKVAKALRGIIDASYQR